MTDEKILDRVFIRKEDREIYKTIRTEEGDLHGVENTDIFLMAMMLGYEKCQKEGIDVMGKESPTLNDGIIRTISFSDDAWILIKSLAVHIDHDVNVLGNNNRMLDIAQRYAFEGISILNREYKKNKHGFLEDLEKLIDIKFKEDEIGF